LQVQKLYMKHQRKIKQKGILQYACLSNM
jgi:hypothetical protein